MKISRKIVPVPFVLTHGAKVQARHDVANTRFTNANSPKILEQPSTTLGYKTSAGSLLPLRRPATP